MRVKTWWTPVLVTCLAGAIAYGVGSGNVSDETARKWEGSNEMIVPAPLVPTWGLCDLRIQSPACPEDSKGWEGSSEDNRGTK